MNQITAFNSLRFFTALIITLMHVGTAFKVTYPFRQGYVGVELFFILSGFLLAKTYEKLTSIPNYIPFDLCKKYFYHRIARLWPEFIFALAMYIFCLKIFAPIKFDSIKISAFSLNVVMLGGLGRIPTILSVSWYISVVLWGGCLLFNLLIFGKEKTKTILLPVIAFLCLFCIINIGSHLESYTQLVPSTYISAGFVRGLMDLVVGMYTFWACQALKIYQNKWNPKVISIALFLGEVISVIGLLDILILERKYTLSIFSAYFYIPFLIGLLYFKKEKLLKFLSWKIWRPFAIISYSLYLTHRISISILKENCLLWAQEHILWSSILVILLSIIFATLCYCGQKYLFKFLKIIALKKQ